MGLNCSLWVFGMYALSPAMRKQSETQLIPLFCKAEILLLSMHASLSWECSRGNKHSLSLFTLIGNLKFLVELGFPVRGQDLGVAVLQQQSSLLPFRIYPTQDATQSGTSANQQHLYKATVSVGTICKPQSHWNHETHDEEQRCKLCDNLSTTYTYLKGYLNLLL